MRLSLQLKQEIKNDILAGASLNKISRRYLLAKSTLCHYYKKLKGKKYIAPYVQPHFSELEGEIVGIFAGDGSQYYDKKRGQYEVRVHFGIRQLDYALYVQELLERYFKKRFRLHKNGPTLRLQTESKHIYNYFHHYLEFIPQIKHFTVKLKHRSCPQKFKIAFIRGLIDTDGSVKHYKDRNKVRIAYYTTSRVLHKQFCHILNELGINYGTHSLIREGYKLMYVVQLHQASVNPFLRIVHPFKERLLPKLDQR